MLVALFITALGWNVLTWFFGIPNSSSHALIGSLIGIALASSVRSRHLGQGVEWKAIFDVLEGLLFSPILGFVLAFVLFQVGKRVLHDRNLFEPPEEGKAPVWWMRGLLILTCTGVSFAHGTNDGQKSIGLIMLTVIGLLPAAFGINIDLSGTDLKTLGQSMPTAGSLIQKYGDDQKTLGVEGRGQHRQAAGSDLEPYGCSRSGAHRLAERRHIASWPNSRRSATTAKRRNPTATPAKRLHKQMGGLVAYAPWWVRILSAIALGDRYDDRIPADRE